MKNRFVGLAIVILLSFACGCAHHKAEEPKSPQVMFDKAKTLGTKGKTQQAIDAYMEVRTIYPSHDLAKKSLLEVADLYYKDKEFESAINSYNEFMQLYPTDPEVASCIYQTGMCHYRQMETVDRDQAETINAMKSFKELLSRYPTSPYSKEARVKLTDAETRLANHYIYIGNFYLKNKNYEAACDRFNEIKKLFPEIAENEGINKLITLACKKQEIKAYDLSSQMESGQYIQKVDNIMVVLDASHSMSDLYNEKEKLELAKDAIALMNDSISKMKLEAGLRTLTRKHLVFGISTYLVYGLAEYSNEKFSEALNGVKKAKGNSLLEIAIDAAADDLKETKGNIAVIIFSDGKEKGTAPIDAAAKMKEKLGERVCIYTVLVGNTPEGKALMDKIAKGGKCGFSVSVDDVSSEDGMAAFVKKIFLAKAPDSDGDGVSDTRDKCPKTPTGVSVDIAGCPIDSDRDGVPDYLDKCPDTPQGVVIDGTGCPLDSDGDGIPDYMDQCAQTPQGTSVDKNGCSVPVSEKLSIELNIEFETNRPIINPIYHDEIKKVADFMKAHPEIKITIEGHTDSTGSTKYNLWLSQERADKVRQYLIDQFGIAPEKLSAKGFGASRPIADNKTPEGRQKNRRVVAVISTDTEKQ